jgi:toxin ParE1/3/4
MRIVWSPTAIENLIEIRTYIEQDKPSAAARVARKIVESVQGLARHPYLGRPGHDPGTRELVVTGTPYLVPYEVYKGRMVILAVLHGARLNPGA